MQPRAILSLETGQHFFGYAHGSGGEVGGEVVFNTSMTGYQEITTDPSYRGQIVVLAYPLINNYGANRHDPESRRPWLAGLVVREHAQRASNWRNQQPLSGVPLRVRHPGPLRNRHPAAGPDTAFGRRPQGPAQPGGGRRPGL